MQMTIDIPEEIVKRAAELNLPVATYVSKTLAAAVERSSAPAAASEGFLITGFDSTDTDRRRATESIREIARQHSLGGLKIEDLIEEGRRL